MTLKLQCKGHQILLGWVAALLASRGPQGVRSMLFHNSMPYAIPLPEFCAFFLSTFPEQLGKILIFFFKALACYCLHENFSFYITLTFIRSHYCKLELVSVKFVAQWMYPFLYQEYIALGSPFLPDLSNSWRISPSSFYSVSYTFWGL